MSAFAKVKCLTDAPGFTGGEEYFVLAFGETACMVLNDNDKVVSVSHDAVNGEGWEIQPIEGQKEKAKAVKSKAEPAATEL